MNPQRKKQWSAAGALIMAGCLLGYLAYGGIEENLVYFWDVQELLEQGEKAHGATVRLGGVVKNKSYAWDEQTLDLSFTIAMAADGQEGVRVHSKGAPPQMFREGTGVVVEGSYDGKVFDAQRVIVKHSNEYKAPAEGERPEQLYRTLLDSTES
jgi:cytochrome c-type biogenesis protein CcmE